MEKATSIKASALECSEAYAKVHPLEAELTEYVKSVINKIQSFNKEHNLSGHRLSWADDVHTVSVKANHVEENGIWIEYTKFYNERYRFFLGFDQMENIEIHLQQELKNFS